MRIEAHREKLIARPNRSVIKRLRASQPAAKVVTQGVLKDHRLTVFDAFVDDLLREIGGRLGGKGGNQEGGKGQGV
ncbi:hypothetical protein LBMAG49_27470 [Planctomycetota bacterium]|nr:hypothetical protein LBMAG49_27470 [Planctomycetota bacterium]